MPKIRNIFGVGERFRVKTYDGLDDQEYIPPSDFNINKSKKKSKFAFGVGDRFKIVW